MLSYTRHPNLDFTYFISYGETTIENWLETIREYGVAGMTSRELYDLRLHHNLFSNEEIERILEVAVNNRTIHNDDRKTALVVQSQAQFGLSRMYELRSEVKGVITKTQVFYRLDEAIAWLDDDLAGCVFDLPTEPSQE